MAWAPELSPLSTFPPHCAVSGECRLRMFQLPVCPGDGRPGSNFVVLDNSGSQPAIPVPTPPWPPERQLPKGHVPTVLRMDAGWPEAAVASLGKLGTSLSPSPLATHSCAAQIFAHFHFSFRIMFSRHNIPTDFLIIL